MISRRSIDVLPTPMHCHPSLSSVEDHRLVVRIPVGDASFEYEIRIRWRTAHTSVYVCLNWPLYGNGPGAAQWKRIDSTRCVSRIGVTPVGRFASGCFRSKGFNIKPRPRLASPAPITSERDGNTRASMRRICGEYFVGVPLFFFLEVQLLMFLCSMYLLLIECGTFNK